MAPGIFFRIPFLLCKRVQLQKLEFMHFSKPFQTNQVLNFRKSSWKFVNRLNKSIDASHFNEIFHNFLEYKVS